MRYVILAAIVILAGCSTFGGSQAAGLIETKTVETTPDNASVVPYADLDSESLRGAVRKTVSRSTDGSVLTTEYSEKEQQAVINDYESAGPNQEGYVYITYKDTIIRLRVTVYAD